MKAEVKGTIILSTWIKSRNKSSQTDLKRKVIQYDYVPSHLRIKIINDKWLTDKFGNLFAGVSLSLA